MPKTWCVDYILVQAFDFHGTWSLVTSFSSPLYSRLSNIRFNQQLSQAWAIDRWISGGAPREKLVMGLTGLALTFTLQNVSDAGVGAPATTGNVGPYLGQPGHATCYRVCELIRNGAVIRYDDEQEMAYAVLDDQWVGYANPDSMKAKVQFAYSRQLAGTMFWSLEMDDFQGSYCGTGRYPLLTAVNDAINENTPDSYQQYETKSTQSAQTGSHVPTSTHSSTTRASTTLDSYRLHHKTNQKEKMRFCYFTNWSNRFANFDARFYIRDINVTLCSHLIYAFAKIDTLNMRLVKSQTDDDNGQLINKKGRYFEFNKLKINHPQLVTFLSVGGANADGFQQVVASRETMVTFARNVAIYLRDKDFDGIDIDWEWPDDTYRNKFTMLLQIFRSEFEKEAADTNKPRLLISIAVAVGEETITKSYDIPQIAQSVDYIQVLAFDFHGTWSHVTSFSSPLYSRRSNVYFDQQYSQAWAIDRWISGGAPGEKLVMGLTGLALTFTLQNVSDAGVGAPATPGQMGPYFRRRGHAPYYRVCEMIKNGAVHRYDDEQEMAYAVLGDQWVGYANPDSMKAKVRFAYSRQLAGTVFWSLELDDFLGEYCGAGEYPLLNAINDAMDKQMVLTDQGYRTTATQTAQATTPLHIRLHQRKEKRGSKKTGHGHTANHASKPDLHINGLIIGVTLLSSLM